MPMIIGSWGGSAWGGSAWGGYASGVSYTIDKAIYGVVRIARNEDTQISGQVRVSTVVDKTIYGAVDVLTTSFAEISGRAWIRADTPENLPERWEHGGVAVPESWGDVEKAPTGWSDAEKTGESWEETDKDATSWSAGGVAEPETWAYPLEETA